MREMVPGRAKLLQTGVTRVSPLDVPTGTVRTTRGGILSVPALGSCIAVIALSVTKQIGGIAHVMLPGIAPAKAGTKPSRYAVNAIDELLRRLVHHGVDKRTLAICLVGGGNVLRRDDDTVCQANISSVRDTLKEQGLKVAAAHLGGYVRRTCTMKTKSGEVVISVGDCPPQLLWKPRECS